MHKKYFIGATLALALIVVVPVLAQDSQSGQMFCPSLGRQSTPQECGDATPVCTEGQTPSEATPCKPSSSNWSSQWQSSGSTAPTSGSTGTTDWQHNGTAGQNTTNNQWQNTPPPAPQNSCDVSPEAKMNAANSCGGESNVQWNCSQWSCMTNSAPSNPGMNGQPWNPTPFNPGNMSGQPWQRQAPGEGVGSNQGQNFNPGPNGDDTQRMARELEMEKKRFSKDMGQTQTVKMIQSLIKKLPAGYSAGSEVTDALAKVDSINRDAQAATDMETLNNLRPDLMEALDTLRQGEWKLRSISDIVRMEKQAAKEIAKLKKKLSQTQSSLAKSGVDAGELLQEAFAAIEGANAAYQQAVVEGKNGNVEDAQSQFNDFFQTLGETWQTVGILDAVRGITKGVTSVEKNINAAKKKITNLVKDPEESAELLDLLQQASDKVVELKGMVKSRDFEPEDAFSTFMDLNDLREQIEVGIYELVGKRVDINFFPMEMGKVPTFQMGPQGGPGFGPGSGPQGGPGFGPGSGPQGGFGPGPQGGFGPGPGGFDPGMMQGGGFGPGPQGGFGPGPQGGFGPSF